MKLIIVRHGETVENANRICQGQEGGHLSKKGKMQAKKLAKRLKKEKLDAVYSSDLKRTVDTAREIMKFHRHVPLYLDKRIRERFFGDYQGTSYEKDWDWQSIAEDPKSCIESDLQMCKRISNFVEEILSKHFGETVLVVSHGGVKKILLNKIFPAFCQGLTEVGRIENTAVSVFQFASRKKAFPVLINCSKHLESPQRKKVEK